MKKQQIRTIIIVALVLLFAGISLSRLRIEPPAAATLPENAPVTETTPVEKETPNTSAEEEVSADETINESPIASGTLPKEEPSAEESTGEASGENPESPETTTPPSVEPEPSEEPTPEVTAPPETDDRHVCTIEIRCDTVVDTTKLENQAVAPYVPASGVILGTTEMEYTPGESVFDILLRVTRENNIQMEFREDGLYSGAYIEGINYLYEFDGGSLSGWMYKVDGQFPNYGCGTYTVEDGDAIVWMYTCDLGRDVGDNSTW